MGIIKSINLIGIEDCLKEAVGLSFQISLFQEEYEDTIKQLDKSKNSFSSGDISKDVYDKNKVVLEAERVRLASKINETIKKIHKVNEYLQKVIRGNVI